MTPEPPSQDPPLDAEEAARWWRTAVAHRRAAETLAATGAFPGAVLLVDQAAQCQLKGLLYAVGRGDLARGHSLPRLATRCQEHAALAVDEELEERLLRLAREYESSRYPDALPEGIAPPDFYTDADARTALRTLALLEAAVVAAWQALLAAAHTPPEDEHADEEEP